MNLSLPSRSYQSSAFLLLTVLLISLVTACGEQPTITSTSSPVNPSTNNYPVQVNPKITALPPLTLKVWFASDYYNEPPIVDLMKEFKQAYPNVTITVDHSVWEKMRNRVRDAVGSNTQPDVAHQHAFTFGAQGYAEPLDDLWQQWGAAEQFMPGALDDVTWNNVKYGIPLDINTTFLFYNKEMFREAGLPEPGQDYNYTQLMADARKLTRTESGRFGLALKPGAWDTFSLIRSNGGDLMEEGQGKATAKLDTPANIEILQFVSNLVNKEKAATITPIGRKPEPVDLFMQRKTAMFISGPWDLKTIEKDGPPGLYDTVGTAPMPKGFNGKNNGSVQGGGSLFVPKGAKNREVAFEFMKWAASPRYQMRLAREMGRYPVLNDLYNDPYFTNKPLLKPFLQQLKLARPYKLEAYSLADITWEQVVATIYNGSDAKGTLTEANRAVQAGINSTGSR